MISERLMQEFARYFAPKPEIHVFTELKGAQWGWVRMPGAEQLIHGFSYPLWVFIWTRIFEDTGRDISKDFHVRYVRGRVESIEVRTSVSDFLRAGETLESFTQIPRLELRPKPVSAYE